MTAIVDTVKEKKVLKLINIKLNKKYLSDTEHKNYT